MTSTPTAYNSTVEAALIKIEFEALSVLNQNPSGLTNSQIGACLGLKERDPKQWFTYNLLQGLIRKGSVRRPDGSRLYFAVHGQPV